VKALPTHNPTARELLELVAGSEHAVHSVARRKVTKKSIGMICSCGEDFKLPFSDGALAALRNVPE